MSKGLAYTTMLGIIMCPVMFINYRINQSNERHRLAAEQAKTEIRSKDSVRYINCLEEVDRNIFSKTKRTDFWVNQAKAMEDSLRRDSIAKSAYAKGLNAAKKNLKLIKAF